MLPYLEGVVEIGGCGLICNGRVWLGQLILELGWECWKFGSRWGHQVTKLGQRMATR